MTRSELTRLANGAPDIAFWLAHGWAWLIAGFLIGSIPFGLVVSRVFFKTDLRAAGSGNIGAANALRTMGRGAGIAVLLLDALKGGVAAALPVVALDHRWLTFLFTPGSLLAPLDGQEYRLAIDAMVPSVLGAMCGIAAMLGHCYSPWLGFKGGKGVATFLGVLIAGSWQLPTAFVVVWLAIVLPTGLASLGSIAGTLAAATLLAVLAGAATLELSAPAAALIIWKHRENIRRLIAGNENRLDLLRRSGGR